MIIQKLIQKYNQTCFDIFFYLLVSTINMTLIHKKHSNIIKNSYFKRCADSFYPSSRLLKFPL